MFRSLKERIKKKVAKGSQSYRASTPVRVVCSYFHMDIEFNRSNLNNWRRI